MKKLVMILGLLSGFAVLAYVPETEKQDEAPKIILGTITNNTDKYLSLWDSTPEKITAIRPNQQKQVNIVVPIPWDGDALFLLIQAMPVGWMGGIQFKLDIDLKKGLRQGQLKLRLLVSKRVRREGRYIPPWRRTRQITHELVAKTIEIRPEVNAFKINVILQGTEPKFIGSKIEIEEIGVFPLAEITAKDMAKRIKAGEYTLEGLKGNIPDELIEKIQIELQK